MIIGNPEIEKWMRERNYTVPQWATVEGLLESLESQAKMRASIANSGTSSGQVFYAAR